jgi:peptidoglycan-associated lipoprotein
MRKYAFLLLILFTISGCQNGISGSGDFEPGTQEDLESNVGDYILFDINSARLDDKATHILDRQVEWLKKYDYLKVIVEGHCDERGTREYNLALGAKRASAVKSYLIASDISPSKVSTISYGKERPASKGHDLQSWRENRRAVTIIN